MNAAQCRALARAGAVLAIDLTAIAGNYRRLCQAAGSRCTVAAVVKADAYGLGAGPVAQCLWQAGCKHFFVATLDEAIALRGDLPDPAIYVLNGPPAAGAEEFAGHRLVPVINDFDQLSAAAKMTRHTPIALHIDTGMNRLGFAPAEVPALIDALRGQPGRMRVDLVISHLAAAEQPSHPINRDQRERFGLIVARLRTLMPDLSTSFANSSGLFLGPDFFGDIARAGAALYGINPVPGRPNPMRPVVRFTGRIQQLRFVDRPMTVGYGARFRLAGAAIIATVPVGYADGLFRSLSNRGRAVIQDLSVPIVGRVSMDSVMLDVTALPRDAVAVGTAVDFLGPDHGLDQLADEAGTIGYEVLTGLGRRVPRVYLHTGGGAP